VGRAVDTESSNWCRRRHRDGRPAPLPQTPARTGWIELSLKGSPLAGWTWCTGSPPRGTAERPVAGTAFLLPPRLRSGPPRADDQGTCEGRRLLHSALNARRAHCAGWCGLRTAPKPVKPPSWRLGAHLPVVTARWVTECGERAGVGGSGAWPGCFWAQDCCAPGKYPELQVAVAGDPGAAQLD